MSRRIPVYFLMAAMALPVAAAESVPTAIGPGISLGQIGEVIAGLCVVLAAFAGMALLMRRMPGLRSGRGTAMRVVDGLPIGARDRVLLLEVGATRLLLGVSPGRIQCLHVFDRSPAGPALAAPDFAAQLRASMTGVAGTRQ